MGRTCSTNGCEKNTYLIFVGTSEGKRPLGGPRRRWVLILKWTGWGGVHWICLAQGRDHWRALVNTVMQFRVP
jgi:hypothetical protein